MRTEAELRLEARLTAIEQLLAKVTAGMMLHFSNEEFDTVMRTYGHALEETRIPGMDPALADVFAAQFRDEMLRLLAAVRTERNRVPFQN
jgi:hypothetical protein